MNSRRSSIKSTLKFHLSGSEDEQSLERIHTFNLKSDIREISNLGGQSDYEDKNDKQSPQKLKQLLKYKDLGPQTMRSDKDEKQMSSNNPGAISQQELMMQSISTRD